MGSHKRADCRYCGSLRVTLFLSLGDQPPSDAFLTADQISREEVYPLDAYVCEECFLVQLLDVVSPEELFGDYAYLASTSKALKRHYAELVVRITERFALQTDDVAVDIGCNDGVLLSGYAGNVVAVGVEPSTVADIAVANGFNVIRGFFDAARAKELVERFGRPKIVTATNVYPHVDDISAFTASVVDMLDADGVFVVEASYLVDLIDDTLFDTIYHEHLCYLSLTAMVPFLARHGLEVFDAERVPFGASGGAIRVWMQRTGGKWPVEASVAKMLEDEEAWGVRTMDRYRNYARKVETVRDDLLALIQQVKESGARIGGFGAPAKGSTLLNFARITPQMIEYIAENNERKIGKLTPGSHIPIVSDETFLERMPSYALLLTWNYLDFFLKNSEYIKRGGKFIVPIPEPRVVPA